MHHEVAHDWFEDNRALGWATCPLTEAGFVRVVSNPAYAAAASRAHDLIGRLTQFCGSGSHVFWAASLSLADESAFNLSLIRGHRQLTDVYLLGLAVGNGGRLATFDRTIPLGAVVGATRESLAIVAPAAE